MNRFCFVILSTLMVVLQACVKVEEAPAPCSTTPPKPQPEQAVYEATLNSNVLVKLLNRQPGTVYYMEGPNNYISTGNPFVVNVNSTVVEGTYTIYGVKTTSKCKGEKTTVQIQTNGALPDCGMQPNTLSINLPNPTQFTEGTLINNGPGSVYFKFNGNNTTFTIQCGKVPSKTQTAVLKIAPSASYWPEDDECIMTQMIINQGNYYAYTGDVYVKYLNGKYQFSFCTVTMRNNAYAMFNNCRGNFFAAE